MKLYNSAITIELPYKHGNFVQQKPFDRQLSTNL